MFDTLVGVSVFSVYNYGLSSDNICNELSSIVISVRVPESGVR